LTKRARHQSAKQRKSKSSQAIRYLEFLIAIQVQEAKATKPRCREIRSNQLLGKKAILIVVSLRS
jgi:hypothetical protein